MERESPKAGERVILVAVPPGLLHGLPEEDQRAVESIVGQPVTLVGHDVDGRVELQFDDPFDVGAMHFIRVPPEFIVPYVG